MAGQLGTEHFEKLKQIFPNGTLLAQTGTAEGPQVVRGKFQDIAYDTLVTLEAGDVADKMDRYQQLLVSMLIDQWNWIKDPAHQRMMDENNAVGSLRLAEEAAGRAAHY